MDHTEGGQSGQGGYLEFWIDWFLGGEVVLFFFLFPPFFFETSKTGYPPYPPYPPTKKRDRKCDIMAIFIT